MVSSAVNQSILIKHGVASRFDRLLKLQERVATEVRTFSPERIRADQLSLRFRCAALDWLSVLDLLAIGLGFMAAGRSRRHMSTCSSPCQQSDCKHKHNDQYYGKKEGFRTSIPSVGKDAECRLKPVHEYLLILPVLGSDCIVPRRRIPPYMYTCA